MLLFPNHNTSYVDGPNKKLEYLYVSQKRLISFQIEKPRRQLYNVMLQFTNIFCLENIQSMFFSLMFALHPLGIPYHELIFRSDLFVLEKHN